jgi:hypothetical protein
MPIEDHKEHTLDRGAGGENLSDVGTERQEIQGELDASKVT